MMEVRCSSLAVFGGLAAGLYSYPVSVCSTTLHAEPVIRAWILPAHSEESLIC